MAERKNPSIFLYKEYKIFFKELLENKNKPNNLNYFYDTVIEYDEKNISFAKLIFNNLNEGFIIVQDNNILFANNIICELLGYTEDEILKTNLNKIINFVHPDYHFLLYKIIYEYFVGNLKKDSFETKLFKKDKTAIWIEFKITPVKYNNRPAVQITMLDISKIKESNYALLKNFEKIRSLFSSIPGYVYFKDINYNYISVNNDYAAFLNKTIGEIYGTNDFEFYSDETAKEIRESDLLVIEKKEITSEKHKVILKNGKVKWLLTRKAPYKDNDTNIIGIIGISVDITDKIKILEEKNLFFDLNPAIICIFDINGKIIETNKRWQELLGWSKKELKRKSFFDLIHNNDMDQTKVAMKKVIKGKELINFDNRLLCKNGNFKWLSWNTRLFKNKNLIYGIAYDLTKRISLEEDLIYTIMSIDKNTKSKSEFLVNMGHELRTPLNSILGFSQLLRVPSESNLNEVQKSYINYIYNNSQNLLDMVNDILDLSKIESGKIKFNRERINLIEIVESVLQSFNSSILEKKLKIIKKISDDAGFIEADPVRFRQVIYNLIANAIKFSDNEKIIKIIAKKVNNEIIISIIDQGIGIPNDKVKTISNSFEQVKINNNYGKGLGLTITKKLVELHGGKLRIKSKPGEGSTFTVVLYEPGEKKIVPGKNSNEQQAEPKTKIDYNDNFILIVDDNYSNVDFLKFAFKTFKIRYDIAYSGKEAIDKVKNNKYSMILMDIQMPGIDGTEACKIIKKYNKNIPIVATTAYAMKGDREKFIDAGFDHYLSKPIDLFKLKKIIQNYTRHS